MDRQTEATQVINSLAYLHLLPENEQLHELNLILAFIKKCKRKYIKRPEYNREYIKSIKRVLLSTFGNLYECL